MGVMFEFVTMGVLWVVVFHVLAQPVGVRHLAGRHDLGGDVREVEVVAPCLLVENRHKAQRQHLALALLGRPGTSLSLRSVTSMAWPRWMVLEGLELEVAEVEEQQGAGDPGAGAKQLGFRPGAFGNSRFEVARGGYG